MKTNLNMKLALLTAAGALLYTGTAIADHEKSSIRSSSADAETEMSFEYGHDGLEMNEPAGAAVSSQSYSLSHDADADAKADKILRMYQRGRQHAFWLDKKLAEEGSSAVIEETYHHDTGTVRFGDRDSEAIVGSEIKDPSGADVDVEADLDHPNPDTDVDAQFNIDEPAGAELDVDAKSNLDIDAGGAPSTSISSDTDLEGNVQSNLNERDTEVNIDSDSTSFGSNVEVNDVQSGVAIDEPAGAEVNTSVDSSSINVDSEVKADVTESSTSLEADQNSTSFSGDSQSDLNQSSSTLESSTSVDSSSEVNISEDADASASGSANLQLDDPAGAESSDSRLDSSLEGPNPADAPRNDGGITERSTTSEINASAAEGESYSSGAEIDEPAGADNSLNRDQSESSAESDSSESGLLQDRSSDFQSNNSTDGSISEAAGAEASSSSSSSEEEEDKYHP